MEIKTAELVSMQIPKVTLRDNIDGSIDVLLDDFAFVTVRYDHRYTHNSHRRAIAERIAVMVGSGEAISDASKV